MVRLHLESFDVPHHLPYDQLLWVFVAPQTFQPDSTSPSPIEIASTPSTVRALRKTGVEERGRCGRSDRVQDGPGRPSSQWDLFRHPGAPRSVVPEALPKRHDVVRSVWVGRVTPLRPFSSSPNPANTQNPCKTATNSDHPPLSVKAFVLYQAPGPPGPFCDRNPVLACVDPFGLQQQLAAALLRAALKQPCSSSESGVGGGDVQNFYMERWEWNMGNMAALDQLMI